MLSGAGHTTPDTLITYYLELTDPAQFRPAFIDDPALDVRAMSNDDVSFYRFMYTEVGYQWRWRDRLLISLDELRETISQPGVSIFVLYVQDVPAGYVELAKHGDSTEVAFFGLRAEFQGKGYGKHLLSFGVQQAWADGTKRVFVHTCNLDSPHALTNYTKRGFTVYRIEGKPMPARYQE